MQLLMCSNDITFSPSLSQAYHRRGVGITAGIPNLFLKLRTFDVIHFHWPEELVGFQGASKDPNKTEPILRLIDWWRDRATLAATVHNLVPHSTSDLAGSEARYYAAFYERMDLIFHFSDYSRQRFAEVYPSVDQSRQVVHGLNLFDHLRPLARGRERARIALELPQQARLFALVGSVRKYQEIALVEKAWRRAAGPDDMLLIATPLPWATQKGIRRVVKNGLHRVRLFGKSVQHYHRTLSEEELVSVVEAADALLIPRSGNHLNSGLLPLSMTFGTPVIAPDYGIFQEFVPRGANELYEPGNANAFAQAIRAQAAKDREEVVAINLAASARFGWDRILDRVWPALQSAQEGRTG
jgi:glycosyltransferase involved in cell wall biosynthesis